MRVMNCYCGKDGKVKLISLGHALLEEHSPEGIGSYAAIINTVDRELSAQMKEFLEDIGYRGFANFDMKLDPRDGKYKLFEMNLRQGRSSFLSLLPGTPRDLLGQRPDPQSADGLCHRRGTGSLEHYSQKSYLQICQRSRTQAAGKRSDSRAPVCPLFPL